MASDLEAQLVDLLKSTAGNTLASFTPDDRADLEKYGVAVARLVAARRTATDPAAIADIDREVGNYKTAVSLMADKYMLKAQDAASKAGMSAFKLVATKAFDMLIAAATSGAA